MSRKMALLITGGLVISLLVNIFVVSNIIRFRNDALSVIVTTRDGLSRLTKHRARNLILQSQPCLQTKRL